MSNGCCLVGLWGWLKNNSNAFSAIASIATAVALVFAILSFKNAEKAVEANMMYQVQKDARDIVKGIYADEAVRRYVLTKDAAAEFPEATVRKATGLLHGLALFYASVERLNSYDYVEPVYWDNTKEEICELLQLPNFRTFWQNSVEAQGAQYRPSFKTVGKNCNKG